MAKCRAMSCADVIVRVSLTVEISSSPPLLVFSIGDSKGISCVLAVLVLTILTLFPYLDMYFGVNKISLNFVIENWVIHVLMSGLYSVRRNVAPDACGVPRGAGSAV